MTVFVKNWDDFTNFVFQKLNLSQVNFNKKNELLNYLFLALFDELSVIAFTNYSGFL